MRSIKGVLTASAGCDAQGRLTPLHPKFQGSSHDNQVINLCFHVPTIIYPVSKSIAQASKGSSNQQVQNGRRRVLNAACVLAFGRDTSVLLVPWMIN